MRAPPKLAVGLLIATMVVGVILRALSWSIPLADELTVVLPDTGLGLRAFLESTEWSRNPPLLPWLFSFLRDPATLVLSGRVFTLACSVIAAVPVFFVVRAASGGDAWAGTFSGALVAFSPVLCSEAATFRSYGVFALVYALRLAAMSVVVAEDHQGPRWHWVAYAALTALLPWIHYVAAPLLIFEAIWVVFRLPAHRRLLVGHALSAVAALPLAWLILHQPDRHPSTGAPVDSAVLVVLAGLSQRPLLALGVIVAALARSLRADASGRLAVGQLVAFSGAALAVARFEDLRPSAAALGAVPIAVVAGLLFATPLPRWQTPIRIVATLLVLDANRLAFTWGRPLRARALAHHPGPEIAAFLDSRESGDETWNVYPGWELDALAFEAAQRGRLPVAKDPDRSVRVGRAHYLPTDLHPPPPGRLVVFGCHLVPEGCRPTGGPSCAREYQCPAASAQ